MLYFPANILKIFNLCASLFLCVFWLLGNVLAEAGSSLEFQPIPELTLSLVNSQLEGDKSKALSTIILKSPVSTIKPEIFDLESPPRLVVDFPPVSQRLQKNFKIENHGLIQALRVASHADKLRAVIDFKSEKVPAFYWKQEGEKVTIELKPPPPQEPEFVKSRDPSPLSFSPTILKVSSIKEEIEAHASLRLKEQALETLIPPSSNSKILKGIEFVYNDTINEPVIRLKFNSPMRFTLVKNNTHIYELRISDCELEAPHLSLPYFPPADFTGVTFVKAEAKNSNLTVVFGIEHGSKLSAFLKDGDIFIKSVIY